LFHEVLKGIIHPYGAVSRKLVQILSLGKVAFILARRQVI